MTDSTLRLSHQLHHRLLLVILLALVPLTFTAFGSKVGVRANPRLTLEEGASYTFD